MGERPPKIPANVLLPKIREAEGSGRVRYAGHAFDRLQERAVTVQEVRQVLQRGWLEKRKDEYKPEHGSWTYAVRGRTVDDRELRVAIAVADDGVIVVTVIDLQARD